MEQFLQNVRNFFMEDVVKFLLSLVTAGVVLLIGTRLVRLCVRAFERSRLAQRMDPTAHSFLRSLLSIALNVLLVLIVAGIVGIPTASIIAVLGSAGVAIGLAMQGSLSNLAGGIMILLFKPFVQGDFIEIPNNEAGRVTGISIFYTTLTTVDNRRVVIPNGTVSNSPVTNFSSQPNRRLDLEFGVEYSAGADAVRRILLDAVSGRARILPEPAPEVVLKRLDSSSMVFELHAWCATGDFLNEKYAVIEDVKRRLDEAGVGIPFPQVDVHMR